MTRFWTKHHLPPILLLTAILLVGFYLRIRGFPESMPFFGDVGRTFIAGQEIVRGHLMLNGPKTSVGSFHLGPFYYYLTALALGLSGNRVVGPGLMVATGGVLTSLLLALYLKRALHWKAALLGTSIFAFSPLVIAQSRIPIEPSLVPLFTLIWLWLATLWWESGDKKWLFSSLATVFLGAQLNFSFVVLGAVSVFAFVWKSADKHMKHWLSFVTGSGLTLLIFLKIYWRGTTSGQYWWSMWQQYTTPQNVFVAGILAALTMFSIGILVKRQEALPHTVRSLFPLWYFWGFFSFCAFLFKTVGGNHALALLFPLPAILLSTALFTQVKPRMQSVIAIFFALLWLSFGTQTIPRENTLVQAQKVTEGILKEADSRTYQLIYRGHLDVYEAADDHWEYLLSRSNNPPQENGKKIYLYSPLSSTSRFPDEGREVVIDESHLLQIPEN